MKIAYYLPSLHAPGGIERIITFKANYFAEKYNYDVFIITSEQLGKVPYFPLSPKVKHIDINVPIDLPYDQSFIKRLINYPQRYYRFKKRLTKTLIQVDADIVLSTLRRELNFITKIEDRSIKIGEFHVTRYQYGAEAIRSKNPIIRLIKKRWAIGFIHNLMKLKKVVLLTHESAIDFPELSNMVVIPNPISTPINGKSADLSAKKAIAVGRYAPQKGFDLLIAAWRLVVDQHPDWILNIYGEGDLKEKLESQIKELNLDNHCFLQPTTVEIIEKYQASSLFILSSRYEGLPLVLGEAMSYGLASVAFACPCGPRDMITDGVDGLLVKNGDYKEMAIKITQLIEDSKLREKIGIQAQVTAKKYTIEQIAKRWDDLFQSSLKNK